MFGFIAKRISVLPRTDVCFLQNTSLVKFISTDLTTTHSSSFVVSYLVNTCGVPQERAIAISALGRVHFQISKKPDMVLSFFRDNGLSNAQISKIIGKVPDLLLCSVDKTLKPKFEFFKSQGISGTDFGTVLCQYPNLLMASLERKIIPYFGVIKSVLHTDAKLIALLKRTPTVLIEDPRRNLVPNVALLEAQGVPADNIAKFLIAQPRSFMVPNSRFSEIVEDVNQMKFDPSQYLFLVAIHGLTSMTRSSLEAKFDVYRRLGLSEDELQCLFRKSPRCMMISEKNIMSTMNYFVNEMGYTPSLIMKQPDVLLYSLKRRIIPRCSVIQILKSKGLVENVSGLGSMLKLREEVFRKRYVIKFEKKTP